jgi:hypothetical protein
VSPAPEIIRRSVPDRQQCRWYDVPHLFNRQMQAEVWEWLDTRV